VCVCASWEYNTSLCNYICISYSICIYDICICVCKVTQITAIPALSCDGIENLHVFVSAISGKMLCQLLTGCKHATDAHGEQDVPMLLSVSRTGLRDAKNYRDRCTDSPRTHCDWILCMEYIHAITQFTDRLMFPKKLLAVGVLLNIRMLNIRC